MEQFRQIRLWDILDILIVAVILYRFLLIMKGTKAAQMLMGLGLVLVAFLLSGHFELVTVNWIIQTLWAQMVIILIVLFQPEIRRARWERPGFSRHSPRPKSSSLSTKS
jgi:diadenylate cyclase